MEVQVNQPLVSVGIPTHNRPEGLRHTLECMIQQTYSNLEIIVSDNSSPGRDAEAVGREFMEKDSRIQYFRQEADKEGIFNWQFGLKNATGKYYMWAADDDSWEPSFVSSLVEALENNPDAVLAFSRLDYTYIDKPPLKRIDKWSKIIKLSKFHRLLYTSCLIPWGVTAHYIYGLMRKDILLKIGGVETRVDGYSGADMVMLFNLLRHGKFIRVDELLFHASQRRTSVESRAQRLVRQSSYNLATGYLKWLNTWHQHFHILRVIVKETSLKRSQKILLFATLYISEFRFYLNSLMRTFIGYILNKSI